MAQVRLGAALLHMSSRAFTKADVRLAWYLPLNITNEFVLRTDVRAVFAPTSENIPQAKLYRTGVASRAASG